MQRYLRIAVTVPSVIAFVLLIALWARSYWWRDFKYVRVVPKAQQMTYYDASSIKGKIVLMALDENWSPLQMYSPSGSGSMAVTGFSADAFPTTSSPQFSVMGFAAYNDGQLRYLAVPHWFPVLLSAALAVLPWVKWRFSLRTLLITTTLIALLFGILVISN